MTVSSETLRSISTPEQLETRLGELDFVDGVPTAETAETVYDHLDFVHALNVFLNGYAGASTVAIRKGFHEAGVEDNQILIFSELMGSESLFLTANADTVYFVGIVDLTSGPMVVETPPQALALFDDMWFHWIIDFGLSGPGSRRGRPVPARPAGLRRRRAGQRLPRRALAHDAGIDARPLVHGRQRPCSDRRDDQEHTEALPVCPRWPRDERRDAARGRTCSPILRRRFPRRPSSRGAGRRSTRSRRAAWPSIELLNELVQEQPAGSTDIELMGQLAAIGIVKGEPFEPDERMRRVLEDAAAVGSATSRALVFEPRASEGFMYYDDGSAWFTNLFVGGYNFETPPPLVTEEGIKPLPATGVRKLHSRTAFFYGYTGITPAMCMRLTGIGSQYLIAAKDADGNPFDGAQTYQVTLPADIPAARFWSLTLYDTETRSMLQTPQRFPRAGSQSYPTPAATADADGTTTVTFAPQRPSESPEGNWIQTTEGKGFFVVLRLYSPLQPFFDKSWRPGEIQLAG